MSLYSGGESVLRGVERTREQQSPGRKASAGQAKLAVAAAVVLLVLCSVPLCSGFFKWERDPHAAQPESVDQEAVEVLPLSDSQGTLPVRRNRPVTTAGPSF